MNKAEQEELRITLAKRHEEKNEQVENCGPAGRAAGNITSSVEIPLSFFNNLVLVVIIIVFLPVLCGKDPHLIRRSGPVEKSFM